MRPTNLKAEKRGKDGRDGWGVGKRMKPPPVHYKHFSRSPITIAITIIMKKNNHGTTTTIIMKKNNHGTTTPTIMKNDDAKDPPHRHSVLQTYR